MNENKFVIDLGDLNLTDEQKKAINASLLKAVANELASIGSSNEVIAIPIFSP